MIKDFLSPFKDSFSNHTELRAQVNTTHAVSILSGDIAANTRVEERGICARVYKNGVYGFASGAEYSEENVKSVLKAAEENAVFLDSKLKKSEKKRPILESGKIICDKKILDVEQKKYIDFLRELDAYIAKKYPGLASRFVMSRCDSMEKLLRVSNGYDSYSLNPRSFVYINLTATGSDGSPVELFKPFGGFGYFDEQFSGADRLFEEADKLYEDLMKKAEGIYPEAGIKSVVMHPSLAGMLAHEAVGHTVEADLVLAGSVAGPSLNKQHIASTVYIDFFV